MLKLVLPDLKYFETAKAGALACLKQKTPYDIQAMEVLQAAILNDDFSGYLKNQKESREGKNLPAGYVPSTVLWLMDDDRFIGLYDIRHALTPFLLQRGGNVAYQIIPAARRQGYVKKGLKLVLNYAHKTLGLDRVLLTCHGENTASFKAMSSVMQEVGGFEDSPTIVDGHRENRVWIDTQQKER